MSSVRLLDRPDVEEVEEDDEWIAVSSPRHLGSDAAVTLVTDAIIQARLDVRLGNRSETVYGEMPEYGSGDAELAADIDQSVAAAWDA
jgi:hypothetical protein